MKLSLDRHWLGLGALAGLLAVAMAAWAAHAAPARLSDGQFHMLNSALTMQGWHALALLVVGLWADRRRGVLPHLAGLAFALGMLAFCGAVYSLAILDMSLGMLAPVGGSTLMLGWALLLASVVKR
jgi:uncharacterized membrane protein YgdD (TMEM256/DUF423 family)